MERGGSSDVRWKTVPQTSGCNRKRSVTDSGQTSTLGVRGTSRDVDEAKRSRRLDSVSAGRRRQTWLRTVEDDLRPLNFDLVTAKMRRALDRSTWRQLMEAATLYLTMLTRERERERERERYLQSPICIINGPISNEMGLLCNARKRNGYV